MHGDAVFPISRPPRVWLVTSGDTPVGTSLTRKLLDHGDFVVTGVDQASFETESYRSRGFKDMLAETTQTPARKDWQARLRVVALELNSQAQCQAAVATAVHLFGKLDVLVCCSSQTVIGAVEELSAHPALTRQQFDANFFGPVHMIKAAIPEMRRRMFGHIIVLTGITGHLGTPGLSIHCSSQWALEGYCDSIAYEIAPFNTRLTIMQSSIEVGILTNKVVSAPAMPQYLPESGHNAPLFRNIMDGLLDRLSEVSVPRSLATAEGDFSSVSAQRLDRPSPLTRREIVSLYPPMTCAHTDKLVAETVHAITAIGGHENPPARHIVGIEGVASVKEKLKTVSEELEEFIGSSASVDCDRLGDKRPRSSQHE